MLFFIDIVLNHTAGNSEWIKEHPEATYNTENCPYLTVAYILDKAITDFDIKLNKDMTEDNDIKTEEDVNKVMHELEYGIIRPLRLFEYFYIDTDEGPNAAQVQEFLSSSCNDPDVGNTSESIHDYVNRKVSGEGEKRYGVTIDFRKLTQKIALMNQDKDYEYIAEKVEEVCLDFNSRTSGMAQAYLTEAVNAVRGEMHYKKIQ